MITILFVDNDPSMLDLATLFLTKDPNINLLTADSADEGWKILKEEQVDGIISDYDMPVKDGLHFLKEVRAAGITIPFIIFTGRGKEEVVINAISYGADYYVTKEGSPREQYGLLLDKIKEIITRRSLEDKKKEKEVLYKTIVDNTGDAIIILNNETIVTANQKVLDIFQVKSDEIVGRSIIDISPPLQQDGVSSHARIRCILARIDTIPSQTFEWYLLKKDGTPVYCEITVAKIISTTDSNQIVAILRDVTDRRLIELNLCYSEDIQREIIEFLPDPTFALNDKGEVIAWNRAMVSLTHTQAEEILGKTQEVYSDLFYQDLRPTLVDLILNPDDNYLYSHYDNVKIEGMTLVTETDKPVIFGLNRIFWLKASPLRKPDGSVYGAIESIRDITTMRLNEAKLKKEEEKYRLLTEQQSDLIFSLLPTGIVDYMSPSPMIDWKGYTHEDVVGMTLEKFFADPDEYITFLKIIDDINRNRRSRTIKFKIFTPDKSLMWVESTLHPVIKDRQIVSIQGVIRDISRQKALEEDLTRAYSEMEQMVHQRTAALKHTNIELKKSREKLETSERILNIAERLAQNGSFEYSLPDRHSIWSDELFVILGYDKAVYKASIELFYSTVHATDINQVINTIDTCIETGKPIELHFKIVKLNGEIRSLHLLAETIFDTVEKTSKTYGSIHDITEFSIVKEKLNKAFNEVNDLYNNAPCGYYSINQEGFFVHMNKTLLDWLQYSSEEVIGVKHFTDIIPLEQHDTFYDNLNRFVKTGQAFDHIYSFIRKNGDTFPISASASAVFNDFGRFVQSRTIVIDITEKVENEAALLNSLREKEALLKEIHHRVKNNLQIISSLLFMQTRNTNNPELKSVLDKTRNRIKSIALVHEKLYHSANYDQIDFSDYIHRIVMYLFQANVVNPDNLKIELDVENVFLRIDKAVPLGIILNELITNSFKHAFPEGKDGTISVFCREEDGKYTLIYSDNGIGLNVDSIEKKGLGMHLIKGLTNQINATLKIESSENAGIVYTIEFIR